MEANMGKKKASGKPEEQDFASELGEQTLNEDKTQEVADAGLFKDSINALQALDKETADPDLVDLGYTQVYYDAAEDADDELDTDDEDDYEEVQPLNIKKIKNDKDSNQVHLSTNHPKHNAQITAQTHAHVDSADSLAQAGKNSAEADHTAHLALNPNLPRASTPYPDPLSLTQISDLLHPSPPLRRRKGSKALRERSFDSDTDYSIMSNTGGHLYGHLHDHVAEKSDNSNANLTPTKHGKTPNTSGSQNAFLGEEQGNAVIFTQNSEISSSSEDHALKPKSSGDEKAHRVLGYGKEEKITPKKSMTNLVTSPKAGHEKKSFRQFFHRKRSKEPTTPPSSSSGNTSGRRIISAPTLIDASPNAKVLLSLAPSLIDDSPNAKDVVNYSRPIALRSSSTMSNGSPTVRDRSNSALHNSKAVAGASTIREGLTDESENVPADLNSSLIHHNPDAPAGHGKQVADEHGVTPKTLATERNADASDGDSFNSSDYSGDENSVRQAVAMPIIFSGRAKLVDVRPPRGTYTTASSSRLGPGFATSGFATSTRKMTDREAEALGAEDADRYCRNAMTSQAQPTNTITDDPFIDPAYRNLIAKPANEIAAKEMARIKAAREASKMGGGLVERMNALRAKSDNKPGAENTGGGAGGSRTNTSESLLSKMRALKKDKKEKTPEESEEEVVGKVQANVERGLREENEIHAIIKAKLAAKEAANGGVRGAGIPRIDYGPPSMHTALGGNELTEKEHAHARAIGARHAAGQTPDDGDNTTARGHMEGC